MVNNMDIGDKVRFKPKFIEQGRHNYTGIIKEIFCEDDWMYCTVLWSNDIKTEVKLHEVSVIIENNDTIKYKSIW